LAALQNTINTLLDGQNQTNQKLDYIINKIASNTEEKNEAFYKPPYEHMPYNNPNQSYNAGYTITTPTNTNQDVKNKSQSIQKDDNNKYDWNKLHQNTSFFEDTNTDLEENFDTHTVMEDTEPQPQSSVIKGVTSFFNFST
jgi:hypothetical protein